MKPNILPLTAFLPPGAALLGALLPAAFSAPGAFPPPLPEWPAKQVATLKLPGKSYPHFFAAQLDGEGVQELVGVADVIDSSDRVVDGVRTLAVYRLAGNRFQQVARSRLSLGPLNPAAGDLDGDGRDEIYALGKANEVVTIRLKGNALSAATAPRLWTWLAGSIAVSDVTAPGRYSLVFAVDTRHSYRSDADGSCNQLVAYRPRLAGWQLAWKQVVTQRGMTLEIHSGKYAPGAGVDLVLEHGPSDVSSARFELWRWTGGKLVRAAAFTTDCEKPMGLQSWHGLSSHLTRSPRAIVSHTIFLRPGQPEKVDDRGEILEWQGSVSTPPKAVYRLAGAPQSVGEFSAPGRAGVLVGDPQKELALYEPAR